jgi:hypothetical protein
MSDANKTDATRSLTKLVAAWCDERGWKPIETEVSVGPAWVADLAGVCDPTQTEAIAMKLIKRKPPRREDWGAWRQTLMDLPSPMTAVVEVKTTVQDFRRDDKFRRPFLPGHLNYLAMPSRMIDCNEVDGRWGILVTHGDGVRCVCAPKIQNVPEAQVLNVVYQTAIRRDHFTRYARFREFDRQTRNTDNERVNRTRVSDAVRMVEAIASGDMSVTEAVSYFLKGAKLPGYLAERLALLAPGAGYACRICKTTWDDERECCPICQGQEIDVRK